MSPHPDNKNAHLGSLGDPLGLYGVKIHNVYGDTKVHVTITIDGLAEPSTFEGTMTDADRIYTITPYIRYKSNALANVNQPFPTTVVYQVAFNNMASEERTQSINVRSINDMPYSIQNGNEKTDTTLLFAAYVNENHPIIDREILKDALAHRAVASFNGYDTDTTGVLRQIFAIWNSLQRHDVKYSSIVAPSGYSKGIQSQHVRLIDESFKNSQANCVDGSVLIASALYKIGMCPVLIMKPGHMFLGVYSNQEACSRKKINDMIFIETTRIGSIKPLNTLQKNWRFKTDTGYMTSISYISLLGAIEAGEAEYNDISLAIRTGQRGYRTLDIDQLRKAGLTPITRESNDSN